MLVTTTLSSAPTAVPCQHSSKFTHSLPPLFLTTPTTEDLEEALLFEFEADDSAAGATPTKRSALLLNSANSVSGASAVSMAPAGSLPSVLSGVRSVTKDAAGTHVLAENFTLHIEEVS